MFRLRFLLGIATLVVPLVATARDGQPTQQWLRVTTEGEMSLTRQYIVTRCVPECIAIKVKVPITVSKEVEVNGKREQRTFTEYKDEVQTCTKMSTVSEVKIATIPIDLKTAKAFETDGKQIPSGDLAKRCGSGALVVVSPNEEMITANYSGLFKMGTIILALPPIKHGYAAPGPLPQPQAPAAPPAPSSSALVPPAKIRPVSFPGSQQVLPVAPAPELVLVSRDGADGVKIRQYEEIPTIAEVTLWVNDSSVSPTKYAMAQQVRRHSRTSTVPLKAIRVSFPSEGNLSQEQIKKKLGQGEVTAVLSTDGKLVDEFWLQNFKSNALIIRGVKLPVDMPMPMAYPAPVSQPILPQPVIPQPAPAPRPNDA